MGSLPMKMWNKSNKFFYMACQVVSLKKAVSVQMFNLSSLPGDGAVDQQVSEAADGA